VIEGVHKTPSNLWPLSCALRTGGYELQYVRQEALWRAAAFADAGADVLFIDALESREEMRAFCSAGGGGSSLPKVRSHDGPLISAP